MEEALQEEGGSGKNPGNKALKKEEELQAPRVIAEGSISHSSPRSYYSIHL